MARLIRAVDLMKRTDRYPPYIRDVVRKELRYVPTVKEPTEKQVEEYCRERCLVVVNSELFNEMKARWSEEPVKRGWVIDGKCSVCNHKMNAWACDFVYCPYCKAKMDEVIE